MAKPTEFANARALPGEGPRKAQLMTVRIGDVEIVLAPFRIARDKLRLQTLRHGVPVHAVHIRRVNDQSSPPRPALIRGRNAMPGSVWLPAGAPAGGLPWDSLMPGEDVVPPVPCASTPNVAAKAAATAIASNVLNLIAASL
jgi:hypothetical protein